MIKLDVKGNVNFEKGMEDWSLSMLETYIDLNDEKKDAVCDMLCQSVEIFKTDFVKIANQEIHKKSFGKYLEVTDVALDHIGTEIFLEVTAKINVKQKQKLSFFKPVFYPGNIIIDPCPGPYIPGTGLFALIGWMLEKAMNATVNNADKIEDTFIKLMNGKMINRKVVDAVSSLLIKKKIPVDIKDVFCSKKN